MIGKLQKNKSDSISVLLGTMMNRERKLFANRINSGFRIGLNVKMRKEQTGLHIVGGGPLDETIRVPEMSAFPDAP